MMGREWHCENRKSSQVKGIMLHAAPPPPKKRIRGEQLAPSAENARKELQAPSPPAAGSAGKVLLRTALAKPTSLLGQEGTRHREHAGGHQDEQSVISS